MLTQTRKLQPHMVLCFLGDSCLRKMPSPLTWLVSGIRGGCGFIVSRDYGFVRLHGGTVWMERRE